MAEPAESQDPPPEFSGRQPDGRRVQLRGGVQEARPGGCQEGPVCADERLAGLVAGRLRPLRAAVHPDGVAQRGHLPGGGRTRRGRLGQPTLRAPEQLAGQRQPG